MTDTSGKRENHIPNYSFYPSGRTKKKIIWSGGLRRFTQTHVHWVSDAIQLSHPLVIPFSCLQSFPALGSFQMSQFFASGGQSIAVSASTSIQFSSVQSLSHARFFATPWITEHQASLSITNSQSSPKLMCIKSVMPSSHLILCLPLLLLPSIFPNIRVFSNESALRIRWPKYWSFSFNISSSNEHSGLERQIVKIDPRRKRKFE